MPKSQFFAAILLPAFMLLASCQPPPFAVYILENGSGVPIAFNDCEGEPHSLAPGEKMGLVDRKGWGIYIKCAFKSGLAVRAGQDTVWSYDASSLKRRPNERYVYGQVPFEDVPYDIEYRPRYHFRITEDGSIALGRYKVATPDPDTNDSAPQTSILYPGTAALENEFAQDQPAGFPIQPTVTHTTASN